MDTDIHELTYDHLRGICPCIPSCACMNGTCPHDVECAVHSGPAGPVTRPCDCSLAINTLRTRRTEISA